jgi:hypothetical protein
MARSVTRITAHQRFSSTRSFQDPRDGANLFEKAFPCLYRYGGIEAERPVLVDFINKEHVKWSLRYFDPRFQGKRPTFPLFPSGAYKVERPSLQLSCRCTGLPSNER